MSASFAAATGNLRRRRALGVVLATLCALAGAFSVCVLFVLLGSIAGAAWARLGWGLVRPSGARFG